MAQKGSIILFSYGRLASGFQYYPLEVKPADARDDQESRHANFPASVLRGVLDARLRSQFVPIAVRIAEPKSSGWKPNGPGLLL